MHMLWYVAIAFIGYVRCVQEVIDDMKLREFIGTLERFGAELKWVHVTQKAELISGISQTIGDKYAWAMNGAFTMYSQGASNTHLDTFKQAVQAYLTDVTVARADETLDSALKVFHDAVKKRNGELDKFFKNVYLLTSAYDKRHRMESTRLLLHSELQRWIKQIEHISKFYEDTKLFTETENSHTALVNTASSLSTELIAIRESLVEGSFNMSYALYVHSKWMSTIYSYNRVVMDVLMYIRGIKTRYSTATEFGTLSPRIDVVDALICGNEKEISEFNEPAYTKPADYWNKMLATTGDILINTLSHVKANNGMVISSLIPKTPDAEKTEFLTNATNTLKAATDAHKVNMVEVLKADNATGQVATSLSTTAAGVVSAIEAYSAAFNDLVKRNTEKMNAEEMKPLVLTAMKLDANVKEQIMSTIKSYITLHAFEFRAIGKASNMQSFDGVSEAFNLIMETFEHLKTQVMSQTPDHLTINVLDVVKLMGEQVDKGLEQLLALDTHLRTLHGSNAPPATIDNAIFTAVSHLKKFYVSDFYTEAAKALPPVVQSPSMDAKGAGSNLKKSGGVLETYGLLVGTMSVLLTL
ncbi:hypothetical protein BgAZ_305330 [Babesia gibsoni]|uniref:Uncharacterized protein n=1 Tax=Babesia gibsoni TaxID=33632 RepID=A0AAD8LHY1_BABGI|nr:hypothetical protein BgAZ_305330 [Babesia gibsoni]